MSRTRAFNETPEQAIKRIHHEHCDGAMTIHTQQDVRGVLLANRENFNERGGSRWQEFQNHVARIPVTIYYALMKKGIIDERNDPDGVRLSKWLDDPDNRAWRSRPGRLGK